jgi:hypothetical protein
MVMEGFSMPNVDALTDGELLQLAKAMKTLQECVQLTMWARVQRLKGDVSSALANENQCHGLWLTLPEWAKW